MKVRAASAHLAFLLLTLLFGTSATRGAAAETPVHLLRMPDKGLQPQVVEAKDRLQLVYLAGDPANADVFYRFAAAGQTNFSKPVRVNNEPGTAIAMGNVRGAQLADDGRFLHVIWNGSAKAKSDKNPQGGLFYTRLSRSANEFEPQRNLMTHTMNLDGGGSVAADSTGNVYVVWHAHEQGDREADESHRAVYVAFSTDFGATFTSERKVNSGSSGVCGCCGLKAFAPNPGQLAIFYRAADAAANRDMVLMVSTNARASFESVSIGKWKVSTCPMSTPALGTSADGRLLAIWETDGQIYWVAVEPSNLRAPISVRSVSGNPRERKHPRFAISAGKPSQLLLSWVEGTGWEKGGALAWEVAGSGSGSARVDGVPPWTFSAVIPQADGSFAILY